MYYFIINTKNYDEVKGERLFRLVECVDSLSKEYLKKQVPVLLSIAVPAFALSSLRDKYPELALYSQHLDTANMGGTTGYLVPEMAASFGANGSIINHSEHRISEKEISELVGRLAQFKMTSIVCARDEKEIFQYTKLSPDLVAIEPPQLIGSGMAVSKAEPELIVHSKQAMERAVGMTGKCPTLVCGAGIVSPVDSKKAIELGSEGILVASGIIKAKNWTESIRGLADGIIAGARNRQAQ